MYRFIAQLLLLTVPASLLAQDFFGTITDSRTGAPVPGVVITLADGTAATSNAEGYYAFESLPAIPEWVTFQKEEYVSLEISPRLGQRELNLRMSRNDYITEEVLISANRASEKTATTYSTLTDEEIERINFGQDMPLLLDQLPSTVVNSDAGAGVGYTGIRIRGSDPTRTNVTINGIPLNDPESHGVFWVNLPDLASSVNSIQVQRGVGTSTNGSAAFGASVNIETSTVSPDAYAEIANSYGSFNTRKHTLNAGTGLIKDRFAVDARLSRIYSDGWVDRAFTDMQSYFVSAGYYGKKHLLKALVFSGNEQTYQSWWGVPESYLDDPELRRSNYYTYENETDNYRQTHYQLHYSTQAWSDLTIRASLHYTKGAGYFEQFRDQENLTDYGLMPLQLIQGSDTITRSDLIRRRWLDNDFYGAIASIQYQPSEALDLTIGGGWNQYDGDHFGEIIWAQYAGNSDIRERYYENRGLKNDGHVYARGLFQFAEQWSGYADLQLRQIDYRYGGITDLSEVGIDNDQRELLGSVNFLFFNPKVGLTWQMSPAAQAYASFAVANREPVRNDFIDARPGETPLPERLNNLEAGYRYQSSTLSWSANLYWMDYQNQLVLNGELNDVGAAIRENVPDSYRAGIELVAAWQFLPRWQLSGNLTLSRNKIAAYTEYVLDYDSFTYLEQTFQNTDIAFSPNVIAFAQLQVNPVRGLELAWQSKYVGRQFLDNTGNPERSLDPFWVNDLVANYRLTPSWAKEIRLGLQVRNLLNEAYEPNGYTFSYRFGGETFTENYYYPQAGRHFMVNLVLSL